MPKKVVRFEVEGNFTHPELSRMQGELNQIASQYANRSEIERVEIVVEKPVDSLSIVNHDEFEEAFPPFPRRTSGAGTDQSAGERH